MQYGEKVMKDRVLCPVCMRDYEIVLVKASHEPGSCRCVGSHTTTSMIERYIDKIDVNERLRVYKEANPGLELNGEMTEEILKTINAEAPRSECELCKKERKRKNEARKATCPDCGYNGYYICADDKLCPGCKYVRENPPRPKVVTSKSPKAEAPVVHVVEVVEPRIETRELIELHARGVVENGVLRKLTVDIVSPYTDDIYIGSREWYLSGDIPGVLDNISNFISKLLCFDHVWAFESNYLMMLFKYMYKKDGAHRVPLGDYCQPSYLRVSMDS